MNVDLIALADAERKRRQEEPTEMMSYTHREFHIRPDMLEAIRRYVEHGLEPGDFLTAVICNDLAEACGRADADNLRNLPAFVAYFYNEAPSACWGSRAKMEAWAEAAETEHDAKENR